MLKIGDKVLKINNKWLKGQEDPLNLPPYTIRIKCNKYYDEVLGIWVIVEPHLYNGGTKTLVDSENNIWDVTKVSSDWSGLLAENWDLLEVLGANTTGVTNMADMFRNCSSYLLTVPLFDTRSVTNMKGMFSGCCNLTSVPLFNTINVTDMSWMFSKNILGLPDVMKIETVPLFDTRNVTNMSHMFYGCGIKTVPLFDTHNVTNMSNMFSLIHSPGGYNSRLETLPLFDTSNVTDMSSMCYLQHSLKTIPLLNTSKVTNMDSAFDDCTNIETGALALYQQASSQSSPPSSHSYTFRNCGSNTTTGAAELQQIPISWGGLKDG